MKLIVGLGNPGIKYAGTRHNLGFRVVDALSLRINSGDPESKHRALYAITEYEGQPLMLAQPLTYMNLSGRAVRELMAHYDISLEGLLVICDDLDLPPGKIRLRKSGGSGGHRGIQSIIDSLGTIEFSRLRIGVGKPPPFLDGADYVLQKLEQPDLDLTNEALERAVDAVLCFLSEGIESAMNKYNAEG